MRHTFLIVFSFMATAALAQIDSRGHWYDGTITYTATHLEHNNVRMNAMDEGEEHEFILRYNKEVNPNHQIYTVDNGSNGFVNEHGVGTTVHHQKSEGWDVICFYDQDNSLTSVMSNETEWDAEQLNKARWLYQMMGYYTAEEESEFEKRLDWNRKSFSINGIIYPYEIITFNGRVTGFINIKPVKGADNELEGIWEVVPTLQGFHLYYMDTEAGSVPWEWKRYGSGYAFTEANPSVGRFFYASTTLLNDNWFRRFDKPTLRIMRNAILARHGYRFQSKDLQDYFAQEPWYKPAASNNIKLSFVEQLNIALIKNAETEEERKELHERQNKAFKANESAMSVRKRNSYRFEYELIKGDDGDYNSIIVKGYEGSAPECRLECHHDLVMPVSEEAAKDVIWVNDKDDINFDGIPDLQIFLWYHAVGQVAEAYTAYLWTPRWKFEKAEGFDDLYNPEIHPDTKTITSNYRSDINERTFDTYV